MQKIEIKQWEAMIKQLKNNWHKIGENERNEYINELSKLNEAVLDKWVQMDEELHYLKSEIKNFTNECTQYSSKGTSYFELNLYENAIEEFLQEIQSEGHPVVKLFLAYSYLYVQNYDKAKEWFLFLIHSKESIWSQHFAYVGLGCLMAQQGKYDEAIPYYEKSLSLTNNSDVVYNLGMCHFLQKQPKLALPYFKEAIELVPEDGEAYYFLGRCYLELEKYDQACQTWITGLQLVETRGMLQTLAYEMEWMGYYAGAIHCYKRLLTLGYKDVEIYHGLAWNYGLLDMRQSADELFMNLIRENPNHVNCWVSYLWLLQAWGEKVKFEKVRSYCHRLNISHPLIEQML
ncbi:lipopolysaccharide assembly protein LapB [Alkalihalobacillus sp. BA299]|uniref:tetratricopeptide repeat protein n=1 Tax=Alkalihalobacillus sp. BA299 TaxID=2815938 RepID=UPI001ADD1FEC|nr:tetratricopeptide repeat protein [Alkalihalobacillus sp. BA299]